MNNKWIHFSSILFFIFLKKSQNKIYLKKKEILSIFSHPLI
jgi:hypothetical protein